MRMAVLIVEDAKGGFFIRDATGKFQPIGTAAVRDVQGCKDALKALVESGGGDENFAIGYIIGSGGISKKKRFNEGTPAAIVEAAKISEAARKRLQDMTDLSDAELRFLPPAEGLLVDVTLPRKELMAAIRGARIAKAEAAACPDDLEDLKVKELKALVDAEDLDVDKKLKRDELIIAIREARKAEPDGLEELSIDLLLKVADDEDIETTDEMDEDALRAKIREARAAAAQN